MSTHTPPDTSPVRILLIEGNEHEARATEQALTRSGACLAFDFAHDGEEALRMLRREGAYSGTPYPELVLLDVALPTIDGADILSFIRADAGLAALPVIMLTGSATEQDVWATHDIHANGYLQKPFDCESFRAAANAISGISERLSN